MAFKPERPLAYYDMCHLNPDTKRFATLLRDGPPTDDNDWKKGLTAEEVQILEEEAKKKKAERKVKPCAVTECKQTEQAVQMATLERVTLLKKIKSAEDGALILEEDLHQLEKSTEELETEGDRLSNELAALRVKEKKEVKEKVVTATRLKAQLELEILKANAELSTHKEAAQAEAVAATAAKDKSVQQDKLHHTSLPPVNFTKEYAPTHGHKHTGVYRTTASGNKQWSCCMADDEDDEGCIDDHSVGLKSTLVHKHESAHHPYTTRLAEHIVASAEKAAKLHEPITCPPTMNKGFRDVRESHENFSHYSRFHSGSRPTPSLVNMSSPLEKGHVRMKPQSSIITHITEKSGRIGEIVNSSIDSIESRHLNTARTSLVFFEASLARVNAIVSKKGAGQLDRPSTAGAFPLTGSMRVSQKRITSGPFPVFANADLALEYNPAKDKGMARSDVSNSKIDRNMQCLDSASLLANYAKSVNMSGVGQQRHLGLAQMRRAGGRPLTAQQGPHLRTSSTTGVASSLAHYCQKQC